MQDAIKLFRTQLFEAFWDWVETNKEAIGEKWHKSLQKEGKHAENLDTAGGIMATSMWIFNMIANLGVSAGIGPNNVRIHQIDERLDEKSTTRLLHIISFCMCLQYLPQEIREKPIPIISSEKFSLKLFIEKQS